MGAGLLCGSGRGVFALIGRVSETGRGFRVGVGGTCGLIGGSCGKGRG